MDAENKLENQIDEEDGTVLVNKLSFIDLWYSDDIQIRICRLLIYFIIVLLFLIYVAWRLYGPVISNMYTKQGFSSPTHPEIDQQNTRCQDVPVGIPPNKKTD